jgi:hypothetical protein
MVTRLIDCPYQQLIAADTSETFELKEVRRLAENYSRLSPVALL